MPCSFSDNHLLATLIVREKFFKGELKFTPDDLWERAEECNKFLKREMANWQNKMI